MAAIVIVIISKEILKIPIKPIMKEAAKIFGIIPIKLNLNACASRKSLSENRLDKLRF